jgi:hypothetical protein
MASPSASRSAQATESTGGRRTSDTASSTAHRASSPIATIRPQLPIPANRTPGRGLCAGVATEPWPVGKRKTCSSIACGVRRAKGRITAAAPATVTPAQRIAAPTPYRANTAARTTGTTGQAVHFSVQANASTRPAAAGRPRRASAGAAQQTPIRGMSIPLTHSGRARTGEATSAPTVVPYRTEAAAPSQPAGPAADFSTERPADRHRARNAPHHSRASPSGPRIPSACGRPNSACPGR